MKYKNSLIAKKTILTIVITSLSIIALIPLIWMVSASLKLPSKVFTSPIEWFPKNPNWENYKTVWAEGTVPFRVFFFNSIFVTVISVIGTLLTCSMAAYAFSKIKFRGKNLVFMLFLATMMIPTQVTLVPRFMIMKWVSLNDTLGALIIPSIFNMIAMFTLRQAFNAVPDDLLESARMDGAGHLTIFFKIMLPMSVPSLISAGILAFVRSWNDYMNPLIFINSERKYTTTLAIKNYLNVDGQPRYDLAMTASVISLIPVLVVFLFVQKYYFANASTSGMKE